MDSFVVGMTSGLLSGVLISMVSWSIFRRQQFNTQRESQLGLSEEKIALYRGLRADTDFCLQFVGEVLAEVLEAKEDMKQKPDLDLTPIGFNSFDELSNFNLSALRYPSERQKSEDRINELRMRVKKFKTTLKDLLSKNTTFSDIDVLVDDMRNVQTALVEVRDTINYDLKVLTDRRDWIFSQEFKLLRKGSL